MLLPLLFSGFLILAALVDLWTFCIPDWSVGVLLALGVLRLVTTGNWASHLLGALVLFGLFLSLHLLFPHGMGFGDVKLAGSIGLFLGLRLGIVAFLFAFFSGSIVGLFLILLRKKTLKDPLPFGPFLAFGAVVSLFFGEEIIAWYLRMWVL